MSYLEIKSVKIGEGIPKVCLPIVGHTQYEIISQAMTIAALKPDIVEFRADWFDDAFSFDVTFDILKSVRRLLQYTPLLFTFRRKEEGGVMPANTNEYVDINTAALESGLIDMIDLELFAGENVIIPLLELAKKKNVKTVVSNHDFEKTPDLDILVERLMRMIKIGADIPKLAVMPNNNKDVLTLLEATDAIHTAYPDIPIITMSMDGRGMVSRICGEIFGSSVTFGCARKASAPGQIEADELERAIRIVHENLLEKPV